MLKCRCETRLGYESRKCTQAVQGGLLGGHKITPVRQTNAIPPSMQPSTYNWRSAGQLAGPVHENGQLLTTLSVRYHSLSGTMSFCLQRVSACCQPRQATWRVGSKVYVCWSVVITFSPPPMPLYVVTLSILSSVHSSSLPLEETNPAMEGKVVGSSLLYFRSPRCTEIVELNLPGHQKMFILIDKDDLFSFSPSLSSLLHADPPSALETSDFDAQMSDIKI
jgi:hypothetical protein